MKHAARRRGRSNNARADQRPLLGRTNIGVRPTAPATTLQLVSITARALAEYRAFVDSDLIDEIQSLVHELRGLRVLQANSTATGGGVAELLSSLVPLELGCGLDVEWRLLCPDEQLFNVTKAVPHRFL